MRPIDLAVVLAAGGSRRMGTPKALLPLDGQPLVRCHAGTLGRVAARVVVVVGCDADAVRAALPPGTTAVENPDWARSWPADSLRLALLAFPDARSCWVTPVDVLPARPETLDALARRGPPAVPVDPSGARGHPVLLGPAEVEAVRRAAPDGGLATLLLGAPEVPVDDPAAALDFDDPEAWRRIRGDHPDRGTKGGG